MSEFYKGLRLPLAEQGKLLMLNENNEIISAQITENDVLNRTKLATTAPENPVEGDIYFDAANDKIMAYTGTAWVMQDRILNVTTDYEGTYAGSDCFHVNVQGNIVADETTFYVMFHRDANGIGNLDIAPGSYGALYLCNPDGTRIVASDVKEGMIVECIVKDTGGVPKYRAYLTQPLHHIANDLKGGSGYVLSAEQGKVLNEKIDTTKTELETNITNVETTLTQRIEESSGGLSGDITELETRLDTKIEEAETTLNASIEANKTAIESNDADILDLQGKVGVNTTDIVSLNTKVDDAVEGIEKDIAEVEARVTTNETKIATNTSDIAERVTKTDAQPFIKDIAYDAETCTFTFTAYDNSTKVFDLPLENAVKSGYYDEEFDNLVLVLINDTEIKIPAAALIDIYVGSEGNQIKVEVSKDNIITAILKADSVDESFLTEDLRNRLTTIEADIKANKDSITTLNENAALYDASGDLPFRKDAILKINQKLLGSNPDGSTHVLAATLGWNIGTEDEFIQNEFGSSTIHTNLNSIDRPTIEMPTGKEEIAYKSELESAQADITAVTEEVKEIVDTEVASLKEKDTAIETEIAGLKTDDTTIQETITTLEGKVDTADNEIKESITTLEEKVDTKVGDLTNGISQNTTAIEANTAAIDTNKEAISTLDTELDTHIADFEAHKTESTTALNNKVDKNFGTMFVNTCDLMPGNDPDTGYSLLARAIGTYNPHSKASGTDVRAVRSKDGAVKFIQTSDVLQGMQEVIDLEVLPENITFDAQESGLTSTKLPAAVRELKGLVDTNVTDISNLTTTVEGIENVLDTKLEPIEARITANETNIATNTQSIVDLRAKDSELESSITTNVETLNNAIAEANKLIGENTAAIETNTTNIATNTEAIEGINTDLEDKVSWSDIGFKLMYSIEFTTNPNNALPAIYTTTKTSYNDGSHTYLYFKPTEDDLKIKLNNDTLEFSIIPEKIPFDAKDSGLTSLKVPAAIREVKGLIDTNVTNLADVTARITSAETTIATNTTNITANTTAIAENKTAIAERVTKTEAKTFIKDVAYDGETCTFTFTMYDDTTETFDLPLESAVKTGRYDEDKKALILVLMDDTEIEIPADNLIDVYTGAEGNQINVSVSSANVISAILNADSIDESFLTEALRTRLTTMETNITNHTTALETVNTTLENHTTEIAGVQEALANISMEASAITFDNTGTDLTATNVQEALVEINNKIGDILTILEEINGTQYENVNEEVF